MEREEISAGNQGKVKELVLFSLFTALTAIGAFIRVPVPLCPFTLQLLFTTGRQKGWERENPATDSGNPSEKTMDGFVEVTEQMELPF